MRSTTKFLLSLGTLVMLGCGNSGGTANDGSTIPMCTSTMDVSPAMAPATFCQIFTASCPLTHAGYTNMNECMASYTALTTAKPMKQMCQSYHLCQAVIFPAGDNRDNHCGHATGFLGNMACEQDN